MTQPRKPPWPQSVIAISNPPRTRRWWAWPWTMDCCIKHAPIRPWDRGNPSESSGTHRPLVRIPLRSRQWQHSILWCKVMRRYPCLEDPNALPDHIYSATQMWWRCQEVYVRAITSSLTRHLPTLSSATSCSRPIAHTWTAQRRTEVPSPTWQTSESRTTTATSIVNHRAMLEIMMDRSIIKRWMVRKSHLHLAGAVWIWTPRDTMASGPRS